MYILLLSNKQIKNSNQFTEFKTDRVNFTINAKNH